MPDLPRIFHIIKARNINTDPVNTVPNTIIPIGTILMVTAINIMELEIQGYLACEGQFFETLGPEYSEFIELMRSLGYDAVPDFRGAIMNKMTKVEYAYWMTKSMVRWCRPDFIPSKFYEKKDALIDIHGINIV